MLTDFWAILDKRQRRQLYGLFLVFVVNAIFEFFSVGLVLALALSIMSPGGSSGSPRLIAHTLGMGTLASRLGAPVLALAVVAMFFVKGCVGIFANWARAKVVCSQNVVLSDRLLRNYLAKGWPFFLQRSIAELKGHISNDCTDMAHGYINNAAIIATEACVCVALFIGLTLVSPVAMIVMAAFTVVIVMMLNKVLKSHMYRYGGRAWASKIEARKTVEVTLHAVKEVILYHREDYFARRMRSQLEAEGKSATIGLTLMDSPRQVIDFFAVSAFMGFLVFEASMGASLASVGVVASVFATAAYRILPAINRLASAFSSINNLRPVFEKLRPDLALATTAPAQSATAAVMPFREAIELRDLSFRYDDAKSDALSGVSARIGRGQTVGLVGRSGAGKSTLMGLLLGLLTPTAGQIIIDGAPLDSASRRAWQDKLAYVPQTVFLSDDTITNNIAFGTPAQDIDHALLRRVARAAGIADFIETETPAGYDTVIGDEGARLSGGQRQRVAIARALYRRAEVLVFDEATSAQDSLTENIINEAIAALSGEVTIIIIAHRLSSVRHCDNILALDHGRLAQQGDFEHLASETGTFQSLLQAAEPRKDGAVYS